MKPLVFQNTKLRFVETSDAEFVLSLRLDDSLNPYLSKVEDDIEAQRNWIKSYKEKEAAGSEYYFIIERLDGTPCGTVRVYDLKEDSFCWGSWILNKDKTRFAAVESALLVYEFGFNQLGFGNSHFEVMKGNDRVIQFHKKFGAEVVSEDEQNFYFTISQQAVEEAKGKFQRRV